MKRTKTHAFNFVLDFEKYKTMKRLFTLLLVVVHTMINWASVYNGTCGENLTWSLNTEDSTLAIEGSGFMYSSSPWSSYRSYIYYVSLPEGLKNIGSHSFEQCSNLRYIKIPNSVQSIDQTAFWLCTSLTSIEIPDNVGFVDQLAFINCTNLQTVIIGSSVSTIDRWAFSGCEKLNTIVCKSTTPPELGSDVFQAIDLSKISLYVPAESLLAYQEADQWNSCNIYSSVASGTCGVAGDDVQWALYGDGNIIISGNGKMADYELENVPWALYKEDITKALIVDGVTRLGNNAFNDCYNMTSVTIYRSLNEFGDDSFSSCGSLNAVKILNLEQWCKINFSTFYCNPLHEAEHLYLNGSEITGELVIPNTVVNIGTWAFVNCRGITSVVVPEGVERIGQGSFNNSSISQISLPSTLTSIGGASFLGCANLSSLSIPNNVTTIDEYAFRNCTGLESVTIGNGVESIGNWAFSGCTNLETVILGNSLQSIGGFAFGDDESLTSIDIPNSVINIEEVAFYGCSGLESVNMYATTAPSLGSNVFQNCSSLTSINYPCGSSESYESTWSAYSSYLNEDCEEASITANADPINPGDYYSTYFNGTRKMALPDNGTEAYIAEINDDELTLTMIADGDDVIPANTAVILKATTANFTLVESTADAVTFSGENDLRGVDVVTPLDDLGLTRSTCYVLSGNSTDGVGFYQCNSDNLKAHKAYLPYAGGPAGAPRHIRFVFDETEDVGQVQGENVQGTKVLRKGQLIIIRNGVEYNVAGQIVK